MTAVALVAVTILLLCDAAWAVPVAFRLQTPVPPLKTNSGELQRNLCRLQRAGDKDCKGLPDGWELGKDLIPGGSGPQQKQGGRLVGALLLAHGEKRLCVPHQMVRNVTVATFSDTYALGKKLGEGAFGAVWQATHRISGQMFAVKKIDLSDLSPQKRAAGLAAVRKEAEIMRRLGAHPHIVKLHAYFEDEGVLRLVIDLCEGGDLKDLIKRASAPEGAPGARTCRDGNLTYALTDGLAADISGQMLSAIDYMHSRGIAHRDIKDTNFMLASQPGAGRIRVLAIDFGLSSKFQHENGTLAELCSDRAGSLDFAPPELFTAKSMPYCTARGDLWSVGVAIYEFLCGRLPFFDDLPPGKRRTLRVSNKITKGEFSFPNAANVSDGAQSLVRALMQLDPAKRLNFPGVFSHPWLEGVAF